MNPFKSMYVLDEDEYKNYKRYKANLPPPDVKPDEQATCPIDGRVYPNSNILAHHLKSHVNGYKCNICGRVFKHHPSLSRHLRHHAPQVKPSNTSVLNNAMPSYANANIPDANANTFDANAMLNPNIPDANAMLNAKTPDANAMLNAKSPDANTMINAKSPQAEAKAKKKHKRCAGLNFEAKQWLTLK